MSGIDSDERIAKRTNAGAARRGRPPIDRSEGRENRDSSDSIRRAERRAMLSDVNTLLPSPPKMPGYHLFWATTTNQKDSVEQRQRLGYEFVTQDELPDFHLSTQKSGEATTDRIMVNEMVLMKINEADWEDDMMYKHYDRPLEELQAMKSKISVMQDGTGRNIGFTGGDFKAGSADGFQTLGNKFAPSLEGVR